MATGGLCFILQESTMFRFQWREIRQTKDMYKFTLDEYPAPMPFVSRGRMNSLLWLPFSHPAPSRLAHSQIASSQG